MSDLEELEEEELEDELVEDEIIIEAEDGQKYACKLLGLFEFEEKEYALLLNMGESDNEDASEGPSTVVMELIKADGKAIFRTIESDAEFDRVVNHVRELADEADDEESE